MKLLLSLSLAVVPVGAYIGQNAPQRRPRGWMSATRGFAYAPDHSVPLMVPSEFGLEFPVFSVSPTIEEAEAKHGMPWTTSVDPKAFVNEELSYMPFWNWHLEFMKDNLTNLKVVSCSNGKTDFSYNHNVDKKARITSLCLSSKEYRKIRLTYYDAGENTQVYNAVLYPDPSYNLPVLGVDLLAFNRKKYLAIVDFQPLHDVELEHDLEFSHLLAPIKDSYKNLSGRMSSKFYDETKFFSQQMLFSRFEDEKIISDELFPAFQQYVRTHLDLIRSCDGSAVRSAVLDRQQAYDAYSAERDPATGLFTAMYGAEWADDFVHDFLFSLSKRAKRTEAPLVHEEKAATPKMVMPMPAVAAFA
jgi:15,16-dihydrobiliverdin:ferredoxin oxidoreductase